MMKSSLITRMKKRPETRALLELYLGIVICSVVILIVGVIFIKPRLLYAIGVVVGAFAAMLQAYGIYDTLEQALSLESSKAKSFMMTKSILRLLVCLAVMIISIVIDRAMFVGAVLGLFSLKLSGVFNPVIKAKLLKHEDIVTDGADIPVDDAERLADINNDSVSQQMVDEPSEDELSEVQYHSPEHE